MTGNSSPVTAPRQTIYECSNPASWHPTLHSKQDHHHPPKAWRAVLLQYDPKTDQSWWVIIRLCGLCHDEYHALANAYVDAGGPPPWSIRSSYGIFIQRLVKELWEKGRVPERKMPWTIANPPPDEEAA